MKISAPRESKEAIRQPSSTPESTVTTTVDAWWSLPQALLCQEAIHALSSAVRVSNPEMKFWSSSLSAFCLPRMIPHRTPRRDKLSNVTPDSDVEVWIGKMGYDSIRLPRVGCELVMCSHPGFWSRRKSRIVWNDSLT